MEADKQKALEAAGWKFGSVHEFLGERPMSDSEMAEYIAKVRQEVSEWPEWKKNLLADSVNPYWREEKVMSDSDKMRDEFEKWAVENLPYSLERSKFNGEYKWPQVTLHFETYQAGRKAERAEVERLRAELAAAKAASVPTKTASLWIGVNDEGCFVADNCKATKDTLEWLRERIYGPKNPPTL